MGKGARFAVSVSLVSLGITLAPAAFAQDAPTGSAPAASTDAEKDNEIVVTGSLIQRPNNTAVSPIVTVTEAIIKQAGTPNLQDALNQFPSFTTGGNSGTGGQGTGGRASI